MADKTLVTMSYDFWSSLAESEAEIGKSINEIPVGPTNALYQLYKIETELAEILQHRRAGGSIVMTGWLQQIDGIILRHATLLYHVAARLREGWRLALFRLEDFHVRGRIRTLLEDEEFYEKFKSGLISCFEPICNSVAASARHLCRSWVKLDKLVSALTTNSHVFRSDLEQLRRVKPRLASREGDAVKKAGKFLQNSGLSGAIGGANEELTSEEVACDFVNSGLHDDGLKSPEEHLLFLDNVASLSHKLDVMVEKVQYYAIETSRGVFFLPDTETKPAVSLLRTTDLLSAACKGFHCHPFTC